MFIWVKSILILRCKRTLINLDDRSVLQITRDGVLASLAHSGSAVLVPGGQLEMLDNDSDSKVFVDEDGAQPLLTATRRL
jgi:hypothetical protein